MNTFLWPWPGTVSTYRIIQKTPSDHELVHGSSCNYLFFCTVEPNSEGLRGTKLKFYSQRSANKDRGPWLSDGHSAGALCFMIQLIVSEIRYYGQTTVSYFFNASTIPAHRPLCQDEISFHF